jgi:hypothetical protein
VLAPVAGAIVKEKCPDGRWDPPDASGGPTDDDLSLTPGFCPLVVEADVEDTALPIDMI